MVWGGHGLLLGFCLIVRLLNDDNDDDGGGSVACDDDYTFTHIIQYCYCISICPRQAKKFIPRNSWVYYFCILV